MWVGVLHNPFGIFSKRKYLSFVFAALTCIFAYLFVATPVAHAADAQWKEGKIVYDDKEFTRTNTDELPSEIDIPSNATAFVHEGANNLLTGKTREIIYFSSDTNLTELKDAQYLTFKEQQDKSAKDISNARTISIDSSTASQADAISEEDQESGASSCKVDGLGWIICPITTLLAKGMDWIFSVIDGFLEVRPLGTTNDNVMMRSWGVMRAVANIVFVIAFLIIIYSQLTSMGIGNYGIKKMLPRLIVAAILVNVSYWICAIAIDLSNLLGASLQQVFIDMRNVVLGNNTNSWDLISWESVAGFVLSGGAIGAATVIGGAAALGSLGAAGVGAFYLLLPVLLGAFLSVLVVLLILTARQAILTILVLVSPLAFVAYLLPNTEKWFDKWRDLFINMLVLFPAFSLVFGGAQLAGILIIQNADDITVVILGMAVQVAPLAIVPLLLKLGGNVLTRIAGIVNNPNRGMIDRAKKYSQARYDQSRALTMRRNRGLSTEELKRPRNALRRYAMFRDDDKREREGLQKANEQMNDAMFLQSDAGQRVHLAEHSADTFSQRVKVDADAHVKKLETDPNTQVHADNLELVASKLNLEKVEKRTEEQLAAYRAGVAIDQDGKQMYRVGDMLNTNADGQYVDKDGKVIDPQYLNNNVSDVAKRMESLAQEVAVGGLAAESAKRLENQQFAKYLKGDDMTPGEAQEVRLRAGSIEGETGANRALAWAMKRETSTYNEAVENARAILSAKNYNNSRIVDAYYGESGVDEAGYIDNIKLTDDIKAAMMRTVLTSGDAGSVRRFMQKADVAFRPGHDPDDLVMEMASGIVSSKARPRYFTAGQIDNLQQGKLDQNLQIEVEAGRIADGSRTDRLVQLAIRGDKYNAAETLVSEPKEYLEDITAVLRNEKIMPQIANDKIFQEKLLKIRQQIHEVVSNEEYRGKIGDREEQMRNIYNEISKHSTIIPPGDALESDYDSAKQKALDS